MLSITTGVTILVLYWKLVLAQQDKPHSHNCDYTVVSIFCAFYMLFCFHSLEVDFLKTPFSWNKSCINQILKTRNELSFCNGENFVNRFSPLRCLSELIQVFFAN